MAKPSIELIAALRETASRLKNGAHYAWGHHGACNCGNLVQVVCNLTQGEIIRYAHTGTGEWTELAEEYCGITNAPYTLLVSKLQDLGLTPTDIQHIEYLDDKEVLQYIEGGFRWLKRNKREDAIAYFEAFANMLEEKMALQINIDFSKILSMETSPSEPQPVMA
ncbi:MAG TPA: hypothetical protein PLY34_17625 [Ferruginibacter sp.]|nr:hypothetical protein [Ferruginibacter sp.]HPH90415.1 hypothetical protein [Ferruginibacter sp.]